MVFVKLPDEMTGSRVRGEESVWYSASRQRVTAKVSGTEESVFSWLQNPCAEHTLASSPLSAATWSSQVIMCTLGSQPSLPGG